MKSEDPAHPPESLAPREAAARLIEQLRDGHITNDHFENEFLKLRSSAPIQAAFEDAWSCYSDLRTYKLTDKDALTRPELAMLTRWALFLRSGLEFTWPARPEPVPSLGHRTLGPMLGGAVVLTIVAGIASLTRWHVEGFMLAIALGALTTIICAVLQLRGGKWSHKEHERWHAAGDVRVYPFRSPSEFEAAGGRPEDAFQPARCARCGYDLSGQRAPGCPECGLGRCGSGPTTIRADPAASEQSQTSD